MITDNNEVPDDTFIIRSKPRSDSLKLSAVATHLVFINEPFIMSPRFAACISNIGARNYHSRDCYIADIDGKLSAKKLSVSLFS